MNEVLRDLQLDPIGFRQSRQGVHRLDAPYVRIAPAEYKLESLGKEFHLADSAVPEFHVPAPQIQSRCHRVAC